MDLWRSLAGMVEAEVTGADLPGFLQIVDRSGLEIFHVQQEGPFTIRFELHRRDYRRLKALAQKHGDRIELRRKKGLYWAARLASKRPVLMMGFAILIFMTVFLPTRVLFIEVEGNQQVPENLILEQAARIGIGFGTQRHEIRSERIKNELLQAIPELQWAGVNTYGCRAVLSVRERPAGEKQTQQSGVSSIVASRDGIISKVTTQNGNQLCRPGQAVKAGQVLISGYTDCGICIRATRAEGEVYAQTERAVTAVLPTQYVKKGAVQHQKKKFSLLIGKNMINFCKDSGISDTTCDKMYSVDYIHLPGGFALPIAVVTETTIYYEPIPFTIEETTGSELICAYSEEYLNRSMTGGRIEQKVEILDQTEGVCILRGRYSCVEMIGKTRLEENLQSYE